jgi:hypothetical protein
VELVGARWLGSGGGAGELGRLEVRDGADSWGPVDRETRERRLVGWLGDGADSWDGFGLRGRRGQWAGWARGRVGHKVGRAENKKKRNF